MEKVIKIDITEKHDLVDKYNEKKLSNDLLQYILREAMLAKKNDEIKIIVNKKCYLEEDSIKIIKEGLIDENKRSLLERNINNQKQIFFFIVGFIIIFLSTLIKERTIWKEILIITGWVPIWEMIEMELFPDAYGRKERRFIKKILNGNFEEKGLIIEN